MLRLSLFVFFLPLVVGFCPNGSYEFQKKCYFFKSNATGFAEAELNCNDIGGDLTSIHSGFTNALITDYATDNFHDVKDFWIGFSNVVTPRNYTWIDQSKVDFLNWEPKQPGSISGSKCVAVNLKSGSWKTEQCSKKKPYVCAINSNSGPTTTTKRSVSNTTTARYTKSTTKQPMTTTYTRKYCTGNFTYYEPTNSCYANFFTSATDAKTWNDAEIFCQSLNGHLASIHSDDEFKFIMNFDYFSNSWYWPWLGLSKINQGGTWQWTDGTPTDYLPWGEGQPVYRNQCVFGSEGSFVSFNCSQPATTLCKI
uniref:C-type lectin domain-containing protein n=1 Tax=Panagrolaimus sp. ES5 TaxID=591445 RepID=A0AC34EZT7_9BILA